MEQHKLIVGFDLCNDYSQIACYSYRTLVPESIGEEKDEYLIPTVLGVTHDKKDWIYGKDAIRQEQLGKAALLTNFIDKIIKQEEIVVHEVVFSPEVILEKFFRKCFLLLKKRYPIQNIAQIIVTVREPSLWFLKGIYNALELLDITKERVAVMSHIQCYGYYIIHQKKELWRNDVGIFDFSSEGLIYSQITMNRRMLPIVIETKTQEYSHKLEYRMTQDLDGEQLNFKLEEVVKTALNKQIISTLYFTGKGFSGDWADETIERLCGNRRIFKGQNIYAAGACYAAKERIDIQVQEEFLFLCEGMIAWDITIQVYSDAMMKDRYLTKAGIPWYESQTRLDVILDDIETISIKIRDIIRGEEWIEQLQLQGIGDHNNKTDKISIETRFIEPRICVITVRDLGFGELFPSSCRIWEKVLEL